MQYLLENLNVLKEYKKTLDFLCRLTIIERFVCCCEQNDTIYGIICALQYL